MILIEIQSYLIKHKKASLAELAMHFRTEPDYARHMIHHLVRKGRVHQMTTQKCRHCSSCSPESMEFYQWIDSKHSQKEKQ